MATTHKPVNAAEDSVDHTRALAREHSGQSRRPGTAAAGRQYASSSTPITSTTTGRRAGQMFRDLHKLFDRLATDVLATLDGARRTRPDDRTGSAGSPDPGDRSRQRRRRRPHSTMREMVEEADRHQLVVIKEMRRAAKIADEHGDPGTVDLFSRTVTDSREARVVDARHASVRVMACAAVGPVHGRARSRKATPGDCSNAPQVQPAGEVP